jgi:hypothetical protein
MVTFRSISLLALTTFFFFVQSLGAQTLAAGGHVHYAEPQEAKIVYWEDLRRNRENGWALFGLVQTLRAQGKADSAALVEARLTKAWARADVTLAASRFGRPTRTVRAD